MHKIKWGSTIIALYASTCIFLQFFLHAWNSAVLQDLYNSLKGSLTSEELSLIARSIDSNLSILDGAIIGTFTGILVALFSYLLIDSKTRNGETGMTMHRHKIGLVMFVFYSLVFGITAYVRDQRLLGFDLLFAIIVAGMLWLISSTYIWSFRRRERFFDYSLELRYLDKHYETYKMDVTIGLSAAIAVLASYMYVIISNYDAVPKAIKMSEYYTYSLLISNVLTIMIYGGFLIGVLWQRLHFMDRIAERVKDIDAEKRILKMLADKGKLSSVNINEAFGTTDAESNQYLQGLISELADNGKILEEKSEETTLYRLKEKRTRNRHKP